jgi:hypothetical protein
MQNLIERNKAMISAFIDKYQIIAIGYAVNVF